MMFPVVAPVDAVYALRVYCMDTANLSGPLGLQSPLENVRLTSLACLDIVLAAHADVVVAASAPRDSTESPAAEGSLNACADKVVYGVWMAMHDSVEDIAAYADTLWQRSGLELK